jgi:ubiquinone/menaquinone biosynthesis C-methylase UbiE
MRKPNSQSSSFSRRIFARSLARNDLYQDRIYGTHKKILFSEIRGNVLEIGAGTGINLSYMPREVDWTGIEPNPHMHRYIFEKAAFLGMEVDVRTERAESLSLPGDLYDVVICTLVLCSVPDPSAALKQVLRVLKPGGKMLFIEHVAASEGAMLRSAQRAIRPLWRMLAGGCHPDRETGRLIMAAGFSSVDIEPFEASLPWTIRIIKPHIMGSAVK